MVPQDDRPCCRQPSRSYLASPQDIPVLSNGLGLKGAILVSDSAIILQEPVDDKNLEGDLGQDDGDHEPAPALVGVRAAGNRG